MPLWQIIKNTPADEFAPLPANASNDFIEAALHTARYSKPSTRTDILSDVCDILNCCEEDLQFLFEHNLVPTENRPVIDLELPDYRMRQSEIYKLVAE